MTIKKPIKAQEAADSSSMPATTGGATIADRFKLDMTDPNARKASAGKGAMFAVIAGVLALAVAGVLTFIMYQHWEFLQSA